MLVLYNWLPDDRHSWPGKFKENFCVINVTAGMHFVGF